MKHVICTLMLGKDQGYFQGIASPNRHSNEDISAIKITLAALLIVQKIKVINYNIDMGLSPYAHKAK